MNDEQKREHAEMVRELADAIRHSLGMGYGPPMEGEEGWVPARMIVEDADDEDFDATAQAIMDELREKKERRMAQEIAEKKAKAAEPKPSTDPWAVIGKAEDDGDRIMDVTRGFC